MIYVTLIKWDNTNAGKEYLIVYVGTDYDLARQKANDLSQSEFHNKYGHVQHWLNGVLNKEELIYEL